MQVMIPGSTILSPCGSGKSLDLLTPSLPTFCSNMFKNFEHRSDNSHMMLYKLNESTLFGSVYLNEHVKKNVFPFWCISNSFSKE